MKKGVIFIIIVLGFISAAIGIVYAGQIGLDLIPDPAIIPSVTVQTNASIADYWDTLDTINTTQMEDSGGTLNILETWFTTLWDKLFAAKTTDDLTEGTSNFYDNQSRYNHTEI